MALATICAANTMSSVLPGGWWKGQAQATAPIGVISPLFAPFFGWPRFRCASSPRLRGIIWCTDCERIRPMGPALKPNKIIFLEYLRCYAFLSVLVQHKFPGGAHISASQPNILTETYNLVMPLFWNGGTGVTVFFLVSGYVITAAAKTGDSAAFFIRRAFRIYPLYILAVILQFYLMDGAIPPWQALRPRLTLLGDITHTDQVLNGVDWTLRIEILFYLGMSILCLTKERHRMPTLSICVIPLIILCATLPAFPNWSKNTFDAFNRFAPFLLLGCSVYLFENRRVHWAFLLISTILTYGNLYYRQYLIGIYNISGPPAAGLLFGAAWLLRDSLPHSRFIIWTAGLTYSVYLFHTWGFDFFYKKMEYGEPLNSIFTLFLLFFSCWILSIIVEKPAITIGRWLSTAWRDIRLPDALKQRLGNMKR